jgi:hypothetical protein
VISSVFVTAGLLTLSNIKQSVETGFKRRDPAFVARLFAEYAPTGALAQNALDDLLCSLGIDPAQFKEEKPSNDSSGGSIDFSEFSSLLSKPTALQQWTASMPVAELLADALQRALPGIGDPLREASELAADATALVCEAVRCGLERMLAEQTQTLREGFALMAAAETNRAAEKYTVVSMSAGTADDYHRGLEGRIGAERGRSLCTMHPRCFHQSYPDTLPRGCLLP